MLNNEIFRQTIFILSVILGTFVLTKISNIIITALSKSFSPNSIHWRFLKNVSKFMITVIAMLLIVHKTPALNNFSSALLTSSAIIIAAVSLAAQNSLSNVIGGVFISLFKPFAVGDRIRLTSGDLTGTVIDINFRHTIIVTPQNSHVIIPNAVLNNEIIENSNYHGSNVCYFLDLKVMYDADLALVKSIMERTITRHPYFIDVRTSEEKADGAPVLNILIRDISNSGVDVRAGIWTDSVKKNFKMCSDVRENIVKEFNENGINFASIRVMSVKDKEEERKIKEV